MQIKATAIFDELVDKATKQQHNNKARSSLVEGKSRSDGLFFTTGLDGLFFTAGLPVAVMAERESGR